MEGAGFIYTFFFLCTLHSPGLDYELRLIKIRSNLFNQDYLIVTLAQLSDGIIDMDSLQSGVESGEISSGPYLLYAGLSGGVVRRQASLSEWDGGI